MSFYPSTDPTRPKTQLRRDKLQCFYCDDKFTPNHRFLNKHYLLPQVDDSDPLEPYTDPPDANPLLQILESEHHLSFNALNGAYSDDTLCFQGTVQGVQVHVLLDSGSSDNFLQPCIAQCLKLTIQEAPQFHVPVGNGSIVTT